MTAAPSHEGPDLTLVTTDPEADQDAADVARIINRESVWLPFALSGGHGLKSSAVLRYVAAFDRADNVTGILKWNSKSITARCGLPASRVPVGTLLATYMKKGLLADVKPTVGGCYEVRFPRPEKTLRLPLGTCWTHRWKGSDPAGPRYGEDTGDVLMWLLAIVKVGDWDDHGLTVTTSLPARKIAERSGLSYGSYRRYWATVQRVCAGDPWIAWEQTYRDDMGADAYEFTLDWREVPALVSVQTPTDHEQGGPTDRGQGGTRDGEQGDPRIVSTLYREASALGQCSSSIAPSPIPGPSAPTTSTARRDTKCTTDSGEGKKNAVELKISKGATTSIGTDLATAAAGTRPVAAAGDNDDHTKTDYDSWLLAVVAGLTASSNPRRLPLSLADAQGLYEPLRAAYEAGWMPAPIAASLTRQSPDVQSVAGALRYRVANLPARVNTVVAIGVSKRDVEERSAYERRASSRSAAKYTQTTL